jgi:hypothetical protein
MEDTRVCETEATLAPVRLGAKLYVSVNFEKKKITQVYLM